VNLSFENKRGASKLHVPGNQNENAITMHYEA
jgi:hypothetical protein